MIVTLSGAVYAWGRNSRGQLGLGDTQVGGLHDTTCKKRKIHFNIEKLIFEN